MIRGIVLVGVLTTLNVARAELVTRPIEYMHGDTPLEGYLAYDSKAAAQPRPGVLVVHEWWGCNDFAKKQAEELAKLGYVAFAVDMYGKGVTTTEREKAQQLSGQFKDNPKLMRDRVTAGLDVLRSQPNVDRGKIAAIGFCFGGTTVLQLAYSGADIRGVVSFHGGLAAVSETDGRNIRAKILALHGADDPFIPADEIAKFQDSLRKVKADWQMVYYGGAVHSFTNPAAKGDIPGAQYNAAAAARSRDHMLAFFDEILK